MKKLNLNWGAVVVYLISLGLILGFFISAIKELTC